MAKSTALDKENLKPELAKEDELSLKDISNEAISTPTTPRKRGRKPKSDEDAIDASPTKKKCGTPTKSKTNGEGKAEKKALPTSYEAASEEDKMLLRMKDDENKNWAEIREAWTKMTGSEIGKSTLSSRYTRIKANFVTINSENEARIITAMKDVEERFEMEKWHRIADAVENAGGKRYPPAALQKRFKN